MDIGRRVIHPAGTDTHAALKRLREDFRNPRRLWRGSRRWRCSRTPASRSADIHTVGCRTGNKSSEHPFLGVCPASSATRFAGSRRGVVIGRGRVDHRQVDLAMSCEKLTVSPSLMCISPSTAFVHSSSLSLISRCRRCSRTLPARVERQHDTPPASTAPARVHLASATECASTNRRATLRLLDEQPRHKNPDAPQSLRNNTRRSSARDDREQRLPRRGRPQAAARANCTKSTTSTTRRREIPCHPSPEPRESPGPVTSMPSPITPGPPQPGAARNEGEPHGMRRKAGSPPSTYRSANRGETGITPTRLHFRKERTSERRPALDPGDTCGK